MSNWNEVWALIEAHKILAAYISVGAIELLFAEAVVEHILDGWSIDRNPERRGTHQVAAIAACVFFICIWAYALSANVYVGYEYLGLMPMTGLFYGFARLMRNGVKGARKERIAKD